MFQLTNANGETVDLNTDNLRAYTPTGLGLVLKNTYSVYKSSFLKTFSQIDDPTSSPAQFYLKFGDIKSHSYQSFSDFASFLAYQPYTLTYTTDSGTWYRECNLESLTKTEIGGSTIGQYERLNEILILEFISAWYNDKSSEYQSYSEDDGLAIYGKGYFNAINPLHQNRNYIQKSGNYTDDSAFFNNGSSTWNETFDSTNNSVKFSIGTASDYVIAGLPTISSLPGAGNYQLEVTYASSNSNGANLQLALADSSSNSQASVELPDTGGVFTTKTFLISLTADQASVISRLWFSSTSMPAGYIFNVKNFKLQSQASSIDWSPAPEDEPNNAVYAYLYGLFDGTSDTND